MIRSEAITARLEAIGAGVEISGSQLGALMDDTEALLAVVRAVGQVADEHTAEAERLLAIPTRPGQKRDRLTAAALEHRVAAHKIRAAIAPLTEEETP